MTTETCLITPAYERFRVYKHSHIQYCEGNACAAGLIDFFQRWHTKKLAMANKNKRANDIAEMHRDKRVHDESPYQFHSVEELKAGLLGMYSANTIRKAIKYLATEKKIISIHRNPNPRYHFDKTNYYIFHPERFNDWVKRRGLDNQSECFEPSEKSTPSAVVNSEYPQPSHDAMSETINTQREPTLLATEGNHIARHTKTPRPNLLETPILADTPIKVHRESNLQIDTTNLRDGDINDGARTTNFAKAITNKTPNKTKTLHFTQPNVGYRREQNPTRSFSASAVSDVNLDVVKNAQSATQALDVSTPATTQLMNTQTIPPAEKPQSTPLHPTTQAARATDDSIGERLSAYQQQGIDAVIHQLTQQGRASNPQQLRDEFTFALLDKDILNRCHASFNKKLNVMQRLVETKRWSTPIRLAYAHKQQTAKSQATATPRHPSNVVALNAHQGAESAIKAQQQIFLRDINRLTSKIVSEQALLEQMQGIPGFQALQISVNKTIARHQQAIAEHHAALKALTSPTQSHDNKARAAQ